MRAAARFRVGPVVLLAGLLCGTPAGAAGDGSTESIIFFKNGRALRVAGYRIDGDWVYLTVSKRANPDEEPSEIGVLRATIARLEEDTATRGRGGNVPVSQRGRVANGITPSGFPLAEVRRAPRGSIPHVPAAGTAEARKYKPRSSSPDIDPAKLTAGYVYSEPLRNRRVPQRYIEAARQYNELRRRERQLAAIAAAEGREPPRLVPPAALPRGYTPPPGWRDPNAPPESPETPAEGTGQAAESDGDPHGSGS